MTSLPIDLLYQAITCISPSIGRRSGQRRYRRASQRLSKGTWSPANRPSCSQRAHGAFADAQPGGTAAVRNAHHQSRAAVSGPIDVGDGHRTRQPQSGQLEPSFGEGQIDPKRSFVELPGDDLECTQPLGMHRVLTCEALGLIG